MTGNPIRRDIASVGGGSGDSGDPARIPADSSVPLRSAEISVPRANRRPRLLVMGGSQGARAINSLVITVLAALRDAGVDLLHQTGPHDLDRVREAYKSHGYSPEDVEDRVIPFIHDMADAYRRADLALCRAGATTLAELAATGTPSVLIPFPFAAHDHQTGNARAMAAVGGAVLTPENETEDRDMAGLLLSLLRDPERLDAMARGARALARPEAAGAVAEEIIKLATLRAE